MTKALAPWSLERQSALKVSAEIKPSLIPNSGNGRFAKEAVKEGTVLVKNRMVSATDPDIFDHDVQIRMESVEEMLNLMARFKQHTGESEEVILSKFADFVHSTPNVAHGGPRKATFILGSSFHMNHSLDSNVSFAFAGDRHFYAVAIRDIAEGEEMYINYDEIELPQEFAEYFLSRATPSINVFVESIRE